MLTTSTGVATATDADPGAPCASLHWRHASRPLLTAAESRGTASLCGRPPRSVNYATVRPDRFLLPRYVRGGSGRAEPPVPDVPGEGRAVRGRIHAGEGPGRQVHLKPLEQWQCGAGVVPGPLELDVEEPFFRPVRPRGGCPRERVEPRPHA